MNCTAAPLARERPQVPADLVGPTLGLGPNVPPDTGEPRFRRRS